MDKDNKHNSCQDQIQLTMTFHHILKLISLKRWPYMIHKWHTLPPKELLIMKLENQSK